MVEPRMLIVSSDTGSLPRRVIFTVRSAVFICGETEAMVPLMMVPTEDPALSPDSKSDGLLEMSVPYHSSVQS